MCFLMYHLFVLEFKEDYKNIPWYSQQLATSPHILFSSSILSYQ
jgi:hypothetical protein